MNTTNSTPKDMMFIISGLAALFISALVYLNPRIRNMEDELPDAIPAE